MDFTIPPLLTYIGSWFATIGGLWTLFDRAESVASEDAKKSILLWIKKEKNEAYSSWPIIFIDAFDGVFGKKYISVRFVLLSILSSLIAVFTLLLIWSSIDPEKASKLINNNIYLVILLSAMWNFSADYLSLIETRVLLKSLSNNDSMKWIKIMKYIIIDIILTTVIFLTVYMLFNWVIGEHEKGVTHLYSALTLQGGWPDTPSVGVFLYSTYLTSIWLWMFGISGGIAKITGYGSNALKKSSKTLDFEKYPFRSLGFISMLVATLAYVIIPFI